jgi:Restriction endonuclease
MVTASGRSGGGGTGAQASGRLRRALPTDALGWEEFEDFVERLLSAHRFCSEPLIHVVRIERWGRRGDKQDGIDFEGTLSDGTSAAWQCKRLDSLSPADVAAAVKACTFKAEAHFLVFSGEASSAARTEMRKYRNWQLLDRRGLGRLVNDLPLFKRREVLDATWGQQRRRWLLEVAGEDAFLGVDLIAADRLNERSVLNDAGSGVGREQEHAGLRVALSRTEAFPDVVLVTGPGGRGKSRLLVEALTEFQNSHPGIPVLFLARGRRADADALGELPLVPAVIVVDDVHESLESVEPLLSYARRVAGTQLVLSSRPSGVEVARGAAVKHGTSVRHIAEIKVGELTMAQARKLVESLTTGLGLTFSVREHLAQQAVDTPYVAVIAANLIRRGDLVAPLIVDGAFREEILRRYGEQATVHIEGVDESVVRRFLATHAALGPVEHSDVELKSSLAAFCGLRFKDLLLLTERLHDRGVLVTRSGYTRLVPDVLADHLLEREAAVAGFDAGFVREIWQAFGRNHGPRLVIALAELDWRLGRQGGPSVFAGIWTDVVDELRTAGYGGLRRAFKQLQELTYTQPRLMIELLEEIRTRLCSESGIGPEPEQEDLGEPESSNPNRALHGLTPVEASDVLAALAPLFGNCAAADPDLLETAIDALWDLRRSDSRQPHQSPDHPERVLAEKLANFRALPDASFPRRIVARVQTWLDQGPNAGDVATPLFALGPLLAKEGTDFVTQDARTLAGRPYFVSVTWARPVRDDIRGLLRRQGSGPDLRLAGEAVALLGRALQQVHGYFGQSVSLERITAWENDDLQTIAVLTDIANASANGPLRRHIRDQVSWLAYRSQSLLVRHAALQLLTDLDNRPEDDLADVMLHAWGSREPSRRGLPLPTLRELEAEVVARAEQEVGLTKAQRDDERDADLRATVEHMLRENESRSNLVVTQLVTCRDPAALVDLIDKTAKDVKLLSPKGVPGVSVLLAGIGRTAPDLAGPMVGVVASTSSTALDADLQILIAAWLASDEGEALEWLGSFPELRSEVRLAVGAAFTQQGFAAMGGSFAEIHRVGMQDPDHDVRNTFLVACHTLLAAQPAATVDMMVGAGISAYAAIQALDLASGHEAYAWGAGLGKADAAAVLTLINYAGSDDWTIQRIMSGIAGQHPALVLDHLLRLQQTHQHLPHAVDGLTEVFARHGEALAQWLSGHLAEPGPASAVASLVLNDGMSVAHAQHLTALVQEIDGMDLVGLTQVLADVPRWPLLQPDLARKILVTARANNQGIHCAVREQLLRGMYMQAYGWTKGEPEDLEAAQTVASACAAGETDSELRSMFQQTLEDINQHIEWRRRSDEQEDDES